MTTRKVDPRVTRVVEIFEQEKNRLAGLFKVNLAPVGIEVKSRRSRVVGQAHLEYIGFRKADPYRSKVFINANYFQTLDNFQYVCNQTLTHELCHVVVGLKYGRMAKSHGTEWKLHMRAAGKEPNRIAENIQPHGMGRKSLIVAVQCQCGETFYMSKKSWEKRYRYSHKKCGALLVAAKKIREEER